MRSSSASPAEPERLSAPTGGRLIALAQMIRLVVRLGSAAVLARLLAPSDYGIFGMAAAVFGVLYMARDLGLVTALQHADLPPERFRAACRAGVLGGLGLLAVALLAAWPTGWFFSETRHVPWVLAAMSLSFVFSAAAAPAVGVLYREKRAGLVALLDAVALAAAALAGVVAAVSGLGVWSLVIMTVLTDAVACVLAWGYCPLAPAFRSGGVNWFSVVAGSMNLAGHNIATYLSRTLDQVVVGRVHGAHALGLYGRGAQIAALPAQYGIGPFTGTLVATLARLRDAPAEFAACFRHGLNGLLHVSLAGACACLAVPDLLVLGLFGPQWSSAAPVLRWLGLGLAVQPFLSAPYWLLSGRAESRALLAWACVGVVLTLAACAFAAARGMEAVALAAAVATVTHAALGPVFCAGHTSVVAVDWLRPLLWPAIVHGGLLGILLTLSPRLAGEFSVFSRTIVTAAVVVVYYAAFALVSPRLRDEIRRHLFLSR